MKAYVNSGNTITKGGVLYHSGSELKQQIVDDLKKSNRFDKLVERGTIVLKSPDLDGEVDKETGSKKLKRITVPTKQPAKASKETK